MGSYADKRFLSIEIFNYQIIFIGKVLKLFALLSDF